MSQETGTENSYLFHIEGKGAFCLYSGDKVRTINSVFKNSNVTIIKIIMATKKLTLLKKHRILSAE